MNFGACRISFFNFLPVFVVAVTVAVAAAEKINCRRYILFAFECSQIGNFLQKYTLITFGYPVRWDANDDDDDDDDGTRYSNFTFFSTFCTICVRAGQKKKKIRAKA